ncbi:MAG: hypothetical protein PVG43_05690 [Nitrosopumilaceae archaeon]|jgi:hypothetical protein
MKTRNKILVDFAICFLLLLPLDVSVYAQNENIRVDDPSFEKQSLQTGETMTPQGSLTIVIIQSLGAILIVLFIITYAVKKRAKGEKNDKN